ncbi:MAG TPA: hypothetical protein VL025_14640, partial [Thermoanaerobaculia bacterium]|nr:hypothetical protein [Thermoanaerobaculia bacterium]
MIRNPLAAIVLGTVLSLVTGCAASAPPSTSRDSSSMNRIAESYVKLVLAVGQHDADYVDAFYGPPEWRAAAEKAKRPLSDIRDEATSLIAEIEAQPPGAGDELVRLRHQYLGRQLQALLARVNMLSGTRLTFDEESKALYDAVSPHHDAAWYQEIVDQLD